jgi:malate dehydrogenase (oxaloacetate-decarboxylating)(NADP+)
VATTPIKDMDAYRKSLSERITASRDRVNTFISSYND